MKIRNFRPDDMEKVVGFKKTSVRISFPDSSYDTELFKRNLLKQHKKTPETIKVVEDDGRVVGYIWFGIRKTARGRAGRIYHVFVEPAYRRHGLATRLNRIAEKWFRSAGIDRIQVRVTKTNRPSLDMCLKLGYKEARLVLEKKLK